MKITNKYNLPKPFVDAVEGGWQQTPDTIRVTQTLKGIREVILELRHHDKITKDVSEMIWAIFGTAVHTVFEQSEEETYQIAETRLKEKIGNLWLSGQFDLYDGKQKIIIDWKTTSVWKIIYDDYADWRKQLLVYAWLMRKAGFEVKGGRIIALLKDHSMAKARRESGYPPLPVVQIDFDFSDNDFAEIETFLVGRLETIEQCLETPDDELPVCTDAERWYTGDTYAVMKGRNKRASRVLDTRAEAEQWIEERGEPDNMTIVKRTGEHKKCQDYCSVSDYCSYWQGLKETELAKESKEIE